MFSHLYGVREKSRREHVGERIAMDSDAEITLKTDAPFNERSRYNLIRSKD